MIQETSNPILTQNEFNRREAWKVTYLIHFWLTFLIGISMVGWKFYMVRQGRIVPEEPYLHPALMSLIIMLVLAWNYFFYRRTYKQYGFWWLAVGTAINLSQFLFALFARQSEHYHDEFANFLHLLHFSPSAITAFVWFLQTLTLVYIVLSISLLRVNWRYQRALDKLEQNFIHRQTDEEPSVVIIDKK